MSNVTSETAPELVAEHFNALTANLGIRSPLTDAFEPIPPATAADFVILSETDKILELSLDPLTGPSVRAVVDKSSGTIQFDPLVLVVE